MRSIYLFRHGITEWNLAGRTQGGESDVPLSAQGYEQAEQLSVRLSSRLLSAIYSSPMQRCLETARRVQARVAVPLIVDPSLTELKYGVAAGRLSAENKKDYPDIYRLWFSTTADQTPDLGFPEGETRSAFIKRISTGMQSLLACSTGDIAISTHSGVIWNFIQYLQAVPPADIKFCEPFLFRTDLANSDSLRYVGPLV
jgi:broad specificity phosphatase PhoE